MAEIQWLWPFSVSREHSEAAGQSGSRAHPSPSIDSGPSSGTPPGLCPQQRTKQGYKGEEDPTLRGVGPCI